MIPHGDQAFTDDVRTLDVHLQDSMPIEAQEWLEAIRPHAARDMFQTFPEAHWAHGSAKVINSPRFRVGALLERLNLRGGHGVYYAPSDFAANRRWIVDVIAAKHVWIDFDDAQMPDEFLLQPHGICNTSPGKHQVIWRVAGMPLDRELHNRVTLTLAKLYGGDEGARGINRVLRLPGFMHLKRDPYRVRIVTISDHRAWDFTELKSAWPLLAIAAMRKPSQQPRPPVTVLDLSAYTQKALTNEVDAVETAQEGARNTVLARSAFNIGTLVGAGKIPHQHAVDHLVAAAMTAGLPEWEARATAHRQVTAGARHPRTL